MIYHAHGVSSRSVTAFGLAAFTPRIGAGFTASKIGLLCLGLRHFCCRAFIMSIVALLTIFAPRGRCRRHDALTLAAAAYRLHDFLAQLTAVIIGFAQYM